MPAVDLVVESPISTSVRARQVCSMFDVPATTHARIEWHGNAPIESKPWSVGMIVGPSGCGKTSIMRQMFGEPRTLEWSAASVIDDVRGTVQDVTDAFSAVGFNTIPAWLRPHAVLSNGEKFRVDLARRLLEVNDVIVVDEFTSVVDRQVAQIGSHAVQKFIRRAGRQFVAVSCHYDIEDWLQPDWVFEPATMAFRWRALQQRPRIEGYIRRVPISVWAEFAPYHYMSNHLHTAAQCFALCIDGRPVAFCATLFRPASSGTRDKIWGLSRTVCLPDFQGLGLAHRLADTVASAYAGCGFRVRSYPAHPSFVRARDKSPSWSMIKKPGKFSVSNEHAREKQFMGGRPCAVFEYVGPKMEHEQARALLARQG